jgi:uncharacterized protein (TIGR02594 family)
MMTGKVPAWLATMQQITGTSAANNNSTIVGWAAKIGQLFPDMATYSRTYTNDGIAWCGLTVGYCMAINGIRPVFGQNDVDRFLYALAWLEFGTTVTTPQAGDVLVFDFGGGDHHVTLYEETQGSAYVCRGGNQSNQVKTSSYAASQCIGIRRPPAPLISVPIAASSIAVPLFGGITATVFGGSADPNTSAYDGHLIDDVELGVALPARLPDPRPNVCVWNAGKSVICKIVDVGPWNTDDPYWLTGSRPEAESGVDNQGSPTNRAGIDLTPAAAKALGISGKGTVDWEFSGTTTQPSTLEASMVAAPSTTPASQSGQPSQAALASLVQQILTTMQPATSASTQPPTQTPQPNSAALAALMQQVLAVIQNASPQTAPSQTSAQQQQNQINN